MEFYTLDGQPVSMARFKKGPRKGQIKNICEIFKMGYSGWQVISNSSCIVVTREENIALARQLNPDSKEVTIYPDQWDQYKAMIKAEVAKYGIY